MGVLRGKRKTLSTVIEFYQLTIGGSSAICDNACSRVTAGGPPHHPGTKKGLLLGIWTSLGLRGQTTAVAVLKTSVANQQLWMGRAKLRHTLCELLYPFNHARPVDAVYKIIFNFLKLIFSPNRLFMYSTHFLYRKFKC